MKSLPDVAAGTSYITSTVSGSYWLLQLLDKVSPSQWAAIGVLVPVLFLGCLHTSPICISKSKTTGGRHRTMSNKAKFSAAMLALLAAGASAPVLFDQFISEKEGNALVVRC